MNTSMAMQWHRLREADRSLILGLASVAALLTLAFSWSIARTLAHWLAQSPYLQGEGIFSEIPLTVFTAISTMTIWFPMLLVALVAVVITTVSVGEIFGAPFCHEHPSKAAPVPEVVRT